jgi:hypothetical protein
MQILISSYFAFRTSRYYAEDFVLKELNENK